MNIIQLIRYPLKSGAPISLRSALGNQKGFLGDREFILVKKNDLSLFSLRDNAVLSDMIIESQGGVISVDFHHVSKQFVVVSTQVRSIKVWSRAIDVTICYGEINSYISDLLGEEVLLGYLLNDISSEESLMDTGPIHIISQQAVENLRELCCLTSLEPIIFRPNIVVSVLPEFSDDHIPAILEINGYQFEIVERTERCNAITLLHKKIHQIDTSEIYNILDEQNNYQGALFGLYLKPISDFLISCGDVIRL